MPCGLVRSIATCMSCSSSLARSSQAKLAIHRRVAQSPRSTQRRIRQLAPSIRRPYTYYTQVSGTITGLRAFAGARIDVSNVGPVQLGAGASNKNVLLGMAVDLNLTVVQAPIAEAFAPTGPSAAARQLGHRPSNVRHSHRRRTRVQQQPAANRNGSAGGNEPITCSCRWRRSAKLAMVRATLSGTVRRQSNYDNQWQLLLNLSNRIDPGAASHPPASGPVELSLPNTYASQGGPIDSSAWRYYTVASGTLVGTGDNSGSSIELTGIAPVQVGLGAGHDNIFFGIASTLAATVTQQPAGGSIILTGDIELRANLSVGCILPPPQVTGGSGQTIESLTHDKIVFTGSDLGFVEQAAIGQGVIANDDRQWFAGYVRVLDHQTVEVSIPQGLPAASYPVRLLNLNRTSNQVSINVQAPLTRRLRTENDRLPGEIQHWVTHQGDITGPAFAFVAVSMSNLPSSLPGVVDLQIGSQFSDLLILGAATQDPTSGSSVVLATTPANLAGFDLYSQSALMDQSFFPLLESDVWFTTY